MTPFTMSLFAVGIVCGIIGIWGLYWAKRESEERRARHRK